MLVETLCMIVLNLGLPNPQVACTYMDEVVEASRGAKIEPEVLIALIYYESRWTPTAVSKAGACGLTQVIPRFMRKPRLTCRQLKNPATAISAGAYILSRWKKRYRGNMERALCGYNAGFSCGPKYKRSHQGWRYARKVLRLARNIAAQKDETEQADYTYRVEPALDVMERIENPDDR